MRRMRLIHTVLLSTITTLVLGGITALPASAAAGQPQRPPAVTLQFAPAQQVTAPHWVRVRRGDTLSRIAGRVYGHTRWWPALFIRNRAHGRIGSNPDMIMVGAVLYVPRRHPGRYHYWAPPRRHRVQVAAAAQAPTYHAAGVLSPAQVGAYWVEAGGPGWAEWGAEAVAMCESGDNTAAWNPSGATGLWQILGSVVPGNLDDPLVNAENAVAKFRDSGDSWAQWVCQP